MAKKSAAASAAPRVADKDKYEYAQMLFDKRVAQKEIAGKVGISEATLSRWIKDGDWRERRAAQSVNRSTIINSILARIDKALDEEGGQANKDIINLSKAVRQLDKEITVVDVIDTFIAFGRWLETHDETAEEIAAMLTGKGDVRDAFNKCVNTLQDRFVNDRIRGKA